ncbi:MAG: HAMP domain-containing protein, partial [Candidatus Bathyarchaeota archaeon]|nr:HAMP domain-containing protein [Candidatus Bathyarchaeota archaeon]
MKIKTQFMVCIVIFSLILIVIAASVANTEQQVAQLIAQEAIASNIERGANSLNSITVDYFLYQQDQKLSLFHTQISFLFGNLSNIKINNLQQQTLVTNVDKDLQGLNESFVGLASYLQNASRNVSVRIDPAFQLRWSIMTGQSLALTSDASQLSRSLDQQAHQANETNLLLIVSLVGTFGVLLATIYFMVFRRTLKSVAELQNGINTIGTGNLEYVIETKRQDEISELSKSFNQMTTNLKTVTASKSDLEKEITERKLAEAATLRHSAVLSGIGR